MKQIPIEPYYDKIHEYYVDQKIDQDFWDWIKQEYGAYQIFLKSNPNAIGEKEACGLLFSDDEDATLFALRWT